MQPGPFENLVFFFVLARTWRWAPYGRDSRPRGPPRDPRGPSRAHFWIDFGSIFEVNFGIEIVVDGRIFCACFPRIVVGACDSDLGDRGTLDR